jgi:hypothetical protein
LYSIICEIERGSEDINMKRGGWTVSVICVFLCLVLQPSISQDSIYPLHGYEYTTEHSHVRVMFGGQASYPFAQGLRVKTRGETRSADKRRQTLREDSYSSTPLPPPPLTSLSKPEQTHRHYLKSTTSESPTLSVKHSPISLFSFQKQTYSLPTSPPNHNSLHVDQKEQLLQHHFHPWDSYPSSNLQSVPKQEDITLQNPSKIYNIPVTKQRPIQHRIKPLYLVNSNAKSKENILPGKITLKNGENFKSKSNVVGNITYNNYLTRVEKHYPKPTNVPSVQFEPFPAYKKRIKTKQVTPSPLYREQTV